MAASSPLTMRDESLQALARVGLYIACRRIGAVMKLCCSCYTLAIVLTVVSWLPVHADPIIASVQGQQRITVGSFRPINDDGQGGLDGRGGPVVPVGGETFLVPPNGGLLDQFEFLVRAVSTPTMQFQAFVSQWSDSESRTLGDVLYMSDVRTATDAPRFQHFVFKPSRVALSPAKTYVAYIVPVSAPLWGIGISFCSSGLCADNFGHDYPEGHFVLGSRLTQTTPIDWRLAAFEKDFKDASFRASILTTAPATTPEPATLLLFGPAAVIVLRGRNGALRRRTTVASGN